MGVCLPGNPVENADIDDYIKPLNKFSGRIKRRILKENGIKTRYYAIGRDGETKFSVVDMADLAIRSCLQESKISLKDVTLLCTATSAADNPLPGLANMLQGKLGAPPMETSSHNGVCCAGLAALQYAAMAIQKGSHAKALVVASEFPSRLFKKSRFDPLNYNIDFDSHFLRWMLSDGAGAILLENRPNDEGLSLQLKWLYLKSFSGDYPVCMQVGFSQKNRAKAYLDYPSFAEAEKEGSILLRQDIRMLPQLIDVGVHEYVKLCREGFLNSEEIDHFLCHYSSEKFAPVIDTLLKKAGMEIPRNRWFSNLDTCGNTGAASIFIILEEFFKTKKMNPGEKILCFVPESGRFTVGFMFLEVVKANRNGFKVNSTFEKLPEPPHPKQPVGNKLLEDTLIELSGVWHDFRSRFWRTPFVQKINRQELTREDYLRWMSCWIPQVREGTRWMRTALANLRDPYLPLKNIIEQHAGEEQFDYMMLFENYKQAGGTAESIHDLKRNPGGEALNAFMYYRASQPNAVDLLGGIYIIEGTGSQIIPMLLPAVIKQLHLPDSVFRFLTYHGENDENHLIRWLNAVTQVLALSPDSDVSKKIVETARITAQLYTLQMENVL